MSKKGKIRVALGSLLALTLVVTCAAVYQSGSKSTPNEKELVKENEEDSVDQAIKTEEREETEDANTSEVEGTRETETTLEEPETPEETTEPVTEQAEEQAAESASASTQNQPVISQTVDLNFTESSLMQWPVNGQVVLDYNMENTVYFPTLNVYKLNPAVAISAEAGAPVTAVANGKVLSIVENEETGTTVTLDMGNGYQAVYCLLYTSDAADD